MSTRGVQRCIKQLAELGIISIKRRTANSNVYTIHLEKIQNAVEEQKLIEEVALAQKQIYIWKNIWENIWRYADNMGLHLPEQPSTDDFAAIDFALKIEPNLIDKKMLALFCDFITDEIGESAAPFNPFIRLKLAAEQLHYSEATLAHHWKSYLNIFGD